MAIIHVTYLDLTEEQRKKAASRVRDQLKAAMGNPFLPAEQQAAMVAQVERITAWEHGKLAVGASFIEPPK